MKSNSDDIATKIILQGVHVELRPAMQTIIRENFSVLCIVGGFAGFSFGGIPTLVLWTLAR